MVLMNVHNVIKQIMVQLMILLIGGALLQVQEVREIAQLVDFAAHGGGFKPRATSN